MHQFMKKAELLKENMHKVAELRKAKILRAAEAQEDELTKKNTPDTTDTSDTHAVPKKDKPPSDITPSISSPLGEFPPKPRPLLPTPGSILALTLGLPGPPPWFPLTVDPIPIKHVPPDLHFNPVSSSVGAQLQNCSS